MRAARLGARLENVEKPARSVDGDHAAGRAHELGQVERRVARPAADVENRLAAVESGALPRTVGSRAPNGVLESESFDFLVMRAEDVVALGRG